jgi:hypothetical protein
MRSVNQFVSETPLQVSDRRNGKGTYVFSNGSKYTGHWLENDIHTKGRFDYACGNYYRGELLLKVRTVVFVALVTY